MKRVYFAHPVSDYGTSWEAAAETAITKALPGCDLVNPNAPDHEAAYQARGMTYFLEVCAGCDAVVAAPFPDGNFGAGVGKEAFTFVIARKPVYLLDRATLAVERGVVGPVLTVEQTRRWLAHYRL